MRSYLTAVVLVVLCALSAAARDGDSLIEELYVLSADGSECLSCPSGEVPEEVRAVLDAHHVIDIPSWIQARFTSTNPEFNSFKNCDHDRVLREFRIRYSGMDYEAEGFTLHYEVKKCLLWDCYKPYLSRIEENGDRSWKRRVPFIGAPIYPFVKDGFVVYVGARTHFKGLIILNAETGRVIEEFTREDEESGFWDSELMFDPGYYWNGHIFLRGQTVRPLDPEAPGASRPDIPGKMYVLKVAF